MSNAAVEPSPGAQGSPRSIWIKGVLITLVVTIPAFFVGHYIIWPWIMAPTPGQMPFYMAESFIEALALGVGVTFLVFALPVVRRVEPELRLRAWLLYLSIGWALVNWWPHGNLHMSTAGNMQALLYIEWGFHVTLAISAAIAAYSFVSLMREWTRRHEEEEEVHAR
jgi:hypothetical protein